MCIVMLCVSLFVKDPGFSLSVVEWDPGSTIIKGNLSSHPDRRLAVVQLHCYTSYLKTSPSMPHQVCMFLSSFCSAIFRLYPMVSRQLSEFQQSYTRQCPAALELISFYYQTDLSQKCPRDLFSKFSLARLDHVAILNGWLIVKGYYQDRLRFTLRRLQPHLAVCHVG